MRKTLTAAIVATLVAATLAGAQVATATSPGTNGKIAFTRGGNVWTMNADGSAPTQVTSGDPTTGAGFASSPAWRPDAQKIAYVDEAGIEVVNPDGTEPQRLLADPSVTNLSWSSDCTKIAYSRSDSEPESTEHIWVVVVASGAATQLTSGVTLDRSPDWSPNGTKIAFTSTRHADGANGSTNHLLYVMQADGTGVTRLTTLADPTGSLHERNPSWKPDGTGIAIRSDMDFGEFPNRGRIVVVSSDGSTRTTLTTADGEPLAGLDPVWSPDGTKLMVGTVHSLVLYDVATRATTEFPGDSEPSWAPANGSCTGSPDTVPPVLSVPAPINVDATGPNGATVAYSATARDAVDLTPTVECTPPSGATFPIGDTTVSCRATDNSGNAASATFTVHVRGAGEQLDDLAATVRALDLAKPTQDKLLSPLDKARDALAKKNVRKPCQELDEFTKEVGKATGPPPGPAGPKPGPTNKKLTEGQARQLLAAAGRIESVLGCG